MRRNRQPKGLSTGGQFARGLKKESSVTLGYFAPTPGHIKHEQWVNDYLPANLHGRVEHSDEEELYLTTKTGLYRFKVEPRTDHTRTRIIGESYSDIVPEHENSNAEDHQHEFSWAYRETLSMDVADRLGKQHFKDTTNPELEPIKRVQAQPGLGLPAVNVGYSSAVDGKPKTEEYVLYEMAPDSYSHHVTREYFQALSNDADYAPGYRAYAKGSVERDDLLRRGHVPTYMLDQVFDQDDTQTQIMQANLDPSGRYLELDTLDDLSEPYRLRYDSQKQQISAYCTDSNTAHFTDEPPEATRLSDIQDTKKPTLANLSLLHHLASGEKSHVTVLLQEFRKARESQQ